MEQYCLYLRKSRADNETEKLSDGEILARHKAALIDTAKRQGLTITGTYEEVGSGDTIAARPRMQQLLEDVEQGMWAGVLVVKVDRLARGDMADQERIVKTFRYSNTKVITPSKTFDLNDKFDLKYFTFSLFMSREEYGFITERLQDGRLYSVIEGKFPGNKAPLGYKRVQLADKTGWTLEPIQEQAEIVRLIFELYTDGETLKDGTQKRLGISLIARRLNELKLPTTNGGTWVDATVRDILRNPHYIGKVRWNGRPNKKSMEGGREVISRPRSKPEDCHLFDGLHEAIIDPTIFARAQELMEQNSKPPIGERNIVKNPLAGIVVCGKCGRNMVRRPYNNGYDDTLMCYDPQCKNVSSKLSYVESSILKGLSEWIEGYMMKLQLDDRPKKNTMLDARRKALKKLDMELEKLENRRRKAHEFYEDGSYDADTFFSRSREIGIQIEKLQKDRTSLESDMQDEQVRIQTQYILIPTVERLLDIYGELKSPAAKNEMLKEILEKVVYDKDVGGRWHGKPDKFTIELFPKLPELHPNH